ncbi:hypothetical protein [Thiogranum longum]|nr:hypothetical protein [Thiogranum longum]
MNVPTDTPVSQARKYAVEYSMVAFPFLYFPKSAEGASKQAW